MAVAGRSRNRRNGRTVALLISVVAGMVALSFASVPLYRLFCAATGFGGTTQRAETPPAVAPREIPRSSWDRSRPAVAMAVRSLPRPMAA